MKNRLIGNGRWMGFGGVAAVLALSLGLALTAWTTDRGGRCEGGERVAFPEIAHAYFPWGYLPTIKEAECDYALPDWLVNAYGIGGEWLTNPACWHVPAEEDDNVGSLNVVLDRTILTNDLIYQLHYYDHANASLYLDLFDTNEMAVATNLFGNLNRGSNTETVATLTIPLATYTSAATIRLWRGSGESTIYESLLSVAGEPGNVAAEWDGEANNVAEASSSLAPAEAMAPTSAHDGSDASAKWFDAKPAPKGLDGNAATNLTTMTGYSTINAAIAASAANDILEVNGGTHTENVIVSNMNYRTLRVKAGQTAVISPASGNGIYIYNSSSCEVNGFEITGTNITKGIYMYSGTGTRIISNYVHHLRAVDSVYGIHLNTSGNEVIGNTLSDIQTNASYSYASAICSQSGGNLIASNYIGGIGKVGYGIQFAVNDRILDNEITSFCTGQLGYGIRAASLGGGDGALISGNYIHQDTWSYYNQYGIMLDYSAGNNIVIHNNRISGCSGAGIAIWARSAGASVTNYICSFNVIDTRKEAQTDGLRDSALSSNTNSGTLSDNLILCRYNVGASGNDIRMESGRLAVACSNNVLLAAGTRSVTALVNNATSLTNTFNGNVYGTGGAYRVLSAPVSFGPTSATDTAAVSGFWAFGSVASNTASTLIGDTLDTNSLGQRTMVVYDTTAGNKTAADTNGVAFVHVAKNWRGTNGLSGEYASLNQTVRFIHLFRDGHALTQVRVAYNQADIGPSFDENKLALYRWNVENFSNQYWQLAAQGNVVNAYFTSNDARRITGAPTSVLGNYGVDTVSNVVWANINYLDEFGLFTGSRDKVATNLTTMTGYTTINAAIAASAPNDILEVNAGTYTENLVVSNMNNRTLRAKAGQTVIIASTNATAIYLYNSASNEVSGFEITGTNIAKGIYVSGSGNRIIGNYIHHLRAVDSVYGIHLFSSGNEVIGNTLINIQTNTSYSYDSAICSQSGGNLIASNYVSGIGKAGYGIQFHVNDRVLDNEITSFCLGQAGYGIRAASPGGGDGALVSGNYIHQEPWAYYNQYGIMLDYSAGNNIVIHNNRISGLSAGAIAFSTRTAGASVSNYVCSFNVIDTRKDAQTDGIRAYALSSNTNSGTLSDNLILCRYNVGASGNDIRMESGRLAVACSNNVLLAAGTRSVTALVNNATSLTNTFNGNVYGTGGAYRVLSAPISFGPTSATDTAAVSGFWAFGSVASNTASTLIGDTLDTNSLGQRTVAVYDTTAGNKTAADTNGVAFVHVAKTWREANGLARGDVILNHTVKFIHLFRDGHVLTQIRLAYNQIEIDAIQPPLDESSLALHRWNVDDYSNQSWQLAVLGNLTNAYFTSNDVRRITGAPTSVLGNYGVDTVSNVIWANVNYLDEFGAVANCLDTDSFENDPVNPNPGTGPGTPPAGWVVSNAVNNGNGLVDVSVANVGSPFAGGSLRSMLMFDNNTVDPAVTATRYFYPFNFVPTALQFDIRFNSFMLSAECVWTMKMYTEAGDFWGGLYVTSAGDGVNGSLANVADDVSLQSLTTGVWYRISMAFTSCDDTNTTCQVSVVDYPALTTNTYNILQGKTGALSSAFTRLVFSSGTNAAGKLDANIDNVTLSSLGWPAGIMHHRAVLDDPRMDYATGIKNLDRLVPWLGSNGFERLDGYALPEWMSNRIVRGQAYGSVVVLPRAYSPIQFMQDGPYGNPLWYDFIVSGGRIVHCGDMPLKFFESPTPQAVDDVVYLETRGPSILFGMNWGWTSPYWGNGGYTVSRTTAADDWGLETGGDGSMTGVAIETTTAAFHVYTVPSVGQAASDWFRNENADLPWSGLVKFLYSADFDQDANVRDVWRAAHYMGQTVANIPAMPPHVITPTVLLNVKPTAGGMSNRYEYVRGEIVSVQVVAASSLSADSLRLILAYTNGTGIVTQQLSGASNVFALDTAPYAYGPYTLTATALSGANVVQTNAHAIGIRYIPPETFNHQIKWVSSPNIVRAGLELDDIRTAGMEVQMLMGGTPSLIDLSVHKDMGFSLLAVISPGAGLQVNPTNNPEYYRIDANSNFYITGYSCGQPTFGITHPTIVSNVAQSMKTAIESVAAIPAFRPYVNCNDDYSVYYGFDYTPAVQAQFLADTGIEAPHQTNTPAQYGVIPDTNLWVKWYDWTLLNVDNGIIKAQMAAATNARPDIRVGPIPGHMQVPLVSMYEPSQYPSYNFGANVFNLICSYYYNTLLHPIMTATFWMEIGRMGNRDLPQWTWPDTCTTAGYTRNNFYHELAGGVKGLVYFYYTTRNTSTWPELKRLGPIVKRIGPVQARLQPAQRDIGLLNSFTTGCFEPGAVIQPYAFLNLMQGHFDVEMVSEDEILAGRAAQYKAVVINDAKYLRQSVYNALTNAASSGLVILSTNIPFNIPGAIRLPLNVASNGNDYYGFTNTVEQIKTALSPYIKPRFQSADIKLVASSFTADNVPYTWFVNAYDQSEFAYSRSLMGAGYPGSSTPEKYRELCAWETAQTAQGPYFSVITSTNLPGIPYDLLTGSQLVVTTVSGTSSVPISMERFGGTLIAWLPQAITSFSSDAPATARTTGGVVRVTTTLNAGANVVPGALPVSFTLKDPNGLTNVISGIVASSNGCAYLDWMPATNDVLGDWTVIAADLASGRSSTNIVTLTQ